MCRTFVGLLLIFVARVQCDYYTSISGLEKLLGVERMYLEALDRHLLEVEEMKRGFDSFLNELEEENVKLQNENMEYYEKPMNAFRTIRRLAVDWQEVQTLTEQIQNLKVYNESVIIADKSITLPTDYDLQGAAKGLSNLQNLYKLDIGNMTKGYIKGQKYNSEMSAFNCFILGKSLFELEEYLPASEWLTEALHKVEDIEKEAKCEVEDNDDNVTDYNSDEDDNTEDLATDGDDLDQADVITYGIFPYVSITGILEYLAPALSSADKWELALAMNSRLLKIDPKNEYGLKNKSVFESGAKSERRKRVLTPSPAVTDIQQLYERVCSGELQQSPQEKRQLRCRYTNQNVSYYILGPLKMEVLNTEPYVAQYYEVISDSEIYEIIKDTKESIERSTIGDGDDIAEVRISKNSWLDYDTTYMQKISQRLQDITGLSMETTEEMQVANYGIGGFYGAHYDFSEDPEEDPAEMGNRLLTAMFYLSQVDLGGSTAFPHLRLAVTPVKGSLIVWYNLHKSLEPDYRTAHAGCPVLKGSKWIGNVWFHAVGQELKRPCALEADDAISKPYQAFGLD